MRLILTFEQEKNIKEHFGDAFFHQLPQRLQVACNQWQLTNLQLLESYSASCVLRGNSPQWGEILLKVSPDPASSQPEAGFLSQYREGPVCSLYGHRPTEGLLLLEYIAPGESLRKEPSLDRRLQVFFSLFEALHQPPKNPEKYDSYSAWVNRITGVMADQYPEHPLTLPMRKGQQICHALFEKYPQRVLLHGDFHHDNMLTNRRGGYTIIDPKGVLGPPLFDIPRFLLNEESRSQEEMERLFFFTAQRLAYPIIDLAQSFFIETVMAHCWQVEDGLPPNLQEVKRAGQLLTHITGQ